jgi:hypothetical protein
VAVTGAGQRDRAGDARDGGQACEEASHRGFDAGGRGKIRG